MLTLPQLSRTLQTILTTVADHAAKTTHFVQRQSKLTGAKFVQTLVFTWLEQPAATYEQLAQTATALDVPISAQGLEQRMTLEAAACLRQVLATAAQELVSADPVVVPLLQRFNGVYLQDSTTITLPNELATLWLGCGGSHEQAAHAGLKVQMQFNYTTGQFTHLDLQPARAQDKTAPMQHTPLPAGALRLADLGYFSVAVCQAYERQGVYTVSRYHPQVWVSTPTDEPVDLVQLLTTTPDNQIERAVHLSREHAWPCRLVALRMPREVAAERRRKAQAQARRDGRTLSPRQLALLAWTIIVTNVPDALLTRAELLCVLRLRWQIELVFKLWKSQGQVDEWRSDKPARILCEVYAKLLGLLLQHWIHLTCGWQYPNRSLVKAGQTIRRHVLALGEALGQEAQMCAILQKIQQCLAQGARLNSRQQAPNHYQLLMACAEQALG